MSSYSGDFEYKYEHPENEKLDQELYIEFEFTAHTDPHYGADADGNRGTERTFYEDVEFTVYNAAGIDITKQVEKEHPQLWKDLDGEVDSRLDDAYEAGQD